MLMEEKEKIDRAVGFCPQCMNHKYHFKAFPQLNKHVATECPVKYGRKNKYTCLNKECLMHSWICSKHKEENKPLYEAHIQEITSKNQKLNFAFVTQPLTPLCMGI